MITACHAKYYAHELTRQAPPGAADQLCMPVFDVLLSVNSSNIESDIACLNMTSSQRIRRGWPEGVLQ